MQYIRKIFYMDLYHQDKKIRNCGYVKMEARTSKTYFTFYLQGLPDGVNHELTANLIYAKEKISFMHLRVKNNSVCEVVMLARRIEEQEIEGMIIDLQDDNRIRYTREYGKEQNPPAVEARKITAGYKEASPAKMTSAIAPHQKEDESVMTESKWEQLKDMFPIVTIFGQETETLLLNPKDLVVLPEEYHHLANNSFLMHGYYNYRQLLLTRWQAQEGYQYYVGVPGTFYDREKSVARMFGFEGFENGEGSRRQMHATQENTEPHEPCVYPGCFGYYMKKVSL